MMMMMMMEVLEELYKLIITQRISGTVQCDRATILFRIAVVGRRHRRRRVWARHERLRRRVESFRRVFLVVRRFFAVSSVDPVARMRPAEATGRRTRPAPDRSKPRWVWRRDFRRNTGAASGVHALPLDPRPKDPFLPPLPTDMSLLFRRFVTRYSALFLV